MQGRLRLVLTVLTVVLAAPSARAAALTLEPIGSYEDPHYVTSDPSNPDRLFVAERRGIVKLVQGGTTTTFVDISAAVNSGNNQQGLQSIAIPPDFATTGFFYVFYTGPEGAPTGGDLHIGELRASGDSAPAASLRNVITIPHSDGTGHNGGQIQFGPDGYLYISTGDGQCCGDPLENGQSLVSLLGKVLRIDPRQSGGASYTVPTDNPFVGGSGADEIWSYGLRNPWRFSFDRTTGAMLVADVGNSIYEEVNYSPASGGRGRGANFGWDCREGMHDFETTGCSAPFTDPIFEYPHSGAGNCTGAITGGYVVRDASLGDLAGRYLYTDFCVNGLRSLVPGLPFASGDRSEGLSVPNVVSFGEDSCGRVYVVEWAGPIYRLRGEVAANCATSARMAPAARCQGKKATITGTTKGEKLRGTPKPDVIVALGGGDRIFARGGNDRICAGPGRDKVAGGAGNDVIRGEPGADLLLGGRGRDVLGGGQGSDRLDGGPGADRLAAGPGKDKESQ